MEISLVLDASSIVKWFVKEQESDEMCKIRDLFLEGKLAIYIPSLVFVELANALRYVKNFTASDVINAVKALKLLHLNVVGNDEILDEAIKIAFNYNITVYDALYVALAKITSSKLVTYDKELLTKFSDIARKASQVLNEIGLRSSTQNLS